jgi:4'-phosphopantetheinyl transferase EntD
MTHQAFKIASLFPAGVAAAEIADSCAPATLLPEEETVLGKVSEKRRLDFMLGRQCARQALRELGIGPVPILRGATREPLWPPGVCGSITHCEGYCAAVASLQSEIRSIGIDAERVQPLSDGVLQRVTIETERIWIESVDSRMPWALVLFSAKESVFKAWFPVVGSWLGFQHARIEFQPHARAFRAVILPEAPGAHEDTPTELTGRFYVDGERVFTSALIPATLPQSRPLEWE